MSEQPIIAHVPGMEDAGPVAEQSRKPVPIDNPGPQTLRTAINSPYKPVYGPNVHGGPVSGEAGQDPVVAPETLALGETAVAGGEPESANLVAPDAPDLQQSDAQVTPVDTEGRSTPRNGHPYFPDKPASREEIAKAAQFGFDLKANNAKYYPYQTDAQGNPKK